MNEAVFKTTVMGGFSKSDVLAFIDKQDTQFKQREKDLLSRVDGLSAGLKNETQRSAQLAKQVAELESQLESEKERCVAALKKSQESSLETVEAKNNLGSEVERRDAEIDKLRLEACELSRRVNEAEGKAEEEANENRQLVEKLELIDKTQDQIGRALLEAQQTADKIVGSAKEEAASMLEKAQTEAGETLEQAKLKADALKAEAQERFDALLGGVADYKKRVSGARADTVEFFRVADSMFASMQENADDVFKKFSDAFKVEDEPGGDSCEAETGSGEEAEEPEAEACVENDCGAEADDQAQTAAQTAEKEAAAVKFDFSAK